MSYEKNKIIRGNKTIISLDGTPLLAADNVSLEITRNVEEVSNLDSGDWKENSGTLMEFSGSLEAKMYADSGETSGHTYIDIMGDFLAGTGEYELTVEMGSEYDNKILQGDIILSKVPFENNREGFNTYSVDFTGTGKMEMVDVT